MTEEYTTSLAAFYDDQLAHIVQLLKIARWNGISNKQDRTVCEEALKLKPPLVDQAQEAYRLRTESSMAEAQKFASQHEYPLPILNALLEIVITPDMEALLNT